MTSRVCGSLLVSLLMVGNAFADGVTYRITDLGALPGATDCMAYDVNDLGQVTGWCGSPRAFTWDPTSNLMTELACGMGMALNDSGQVACTANGGGSSHFWDPISGVLTPVTGTLYDGTVYDINNSGMIAGGAGRAFVFDSTTGKTTDLAPLLPNYSETTAYGINDVNQVVGFYVNRPEQPNESAYLLDLRTGQVQLMGYLSQTAKVSAARAVNNLGQSVGYSAVSSYTSHAFLWDANSGQMTDLGDLPGGLNASGARAINDLGQVVGQSFGYRVRTWDTSISGPRAFIWDQASGMRDINNLIDSTDPLAGVVEMWDATSINNKGQITVIGTDGVYGFRAYLLTPVPSIEDLLESLAESATGVGPGTSLLDKASLITTYYSQSDSVTACVYLESLLNQVDALSGTKHLSQDQADDLAALALAIVTQISCE